MLVVQKIGIEGVGPYKERVTLPIRSGVTVIYGKNKISDNNGNFVGKSLLVRSIEELMYDPLIRQDKKVGSRFLSFKDGEREVSLESHGSRVDVTVNGRTRTQRKQGDNKGLLAKLWPLTQEDFSTYVYVDAASAHPLVKGNSAARKSFFNTFFRLDQMDRQKKVFSQKLLELKKIKAAYSELERTYEEIRKDLLPTEKRKKVEALVEELTGSVSEMMEHLEASERYQRLMAFRKIAGSRLTQKARSIEEVKADLKALRKGQEAAELYRAYQRELVKYASATEGLDMDTPIERLEKANTKYQDALSRTRTKVVAPVRPEEVEEPIVYADQLRLSIKQLEEHLVHSLKSKNGVCYACGQSVPIDADDLRRKIKQAKIGLEAAEEYEEYLGQMKDYAEAKAKWRTEKKAVEEATASVEKLKPLAELYSIRSKLVEPEKVEKPTGVPRASPEELQKELDQAVFLDEHADDIAALRGLKPVEFDSSAFQEMQERLSRLQSKLAVHNGVVERARKLKTRLSELKAQLDDELTLELIVDAYNDKAMKKMAVEAISTRLMELVNRYASLVMPTYTFEFVWEANSIQILAKRPEGISDVRKLSGAESMLFTLILILSLLVFVPDKKRTNVLILDEPTASFSDATIGLFVDLLPHLTNVIPSIIVVTPKKLTIPGARCLTVVKGNRGSYLAKGHPDEL